MSLKPYAYLMPLLVDRRQQVENLLTWLENYTSWLSAPASTMYHCCWEGGLIEHSLNVTNELLRLRKFMAPAIPEESCVITALFHDVGKVGEALHPLYIQKPATNSSHNSNIQNTDDEAAENGGAGEAYIVNPKVTAMGVAVRSLHIVTRFVTLNASEAQAIAYHDGQYIPANREVAHQETPLTLLLHFADYWACHVVEGKLPLWEPENVPGSTTVFRDGSGLGRRPDRNLAED